MKNATLLLGSNVGDKLNYLKKATDHITKSAGNLVKASSLYETAAWGIKDQENFINQAWLIDTELKPHDLLKTLLDIEKVLGRERIQKWGPRIIDIDILYYDDLIINEPDLKIPHPYLQDRKFTLIPLAEISPDWVHPILHKNAREMLKDCKDEGWVKLFNPNTEVGG